MPRQKIGTKLEAAIKAKAALDAEIKALKAQDRAGKQEENEQRFIVLGRSLTVLMTKEPDGKLARDIRAHLERSLTRPAERALFAFLGAASSSKTPA